MRRSCKLDAPFPVQLSSPPLHGYWGGGAKERKGESTMGPDEKGFVFIFNTEKIDSEI
jgi:hypothetical protein